MRLPGIVKLRLRSLLSRGAVEQELEEELNYHLERLTEDNTAAGMEPIEARSAALRALSGLEQRKEECRDMRGFNLIDHSMQDLRFTFRQLRKNPGFTATAIAMIALGLCASVAIFAFVDAALIKPLPFKDPNRLADVTEKIPLFPRANLSYADYLDWKAQNHVFSSLEVYSNRGYILNTPSGSEHADGVRVSDGFFRTLGVSPILGRNFYRGEDLNGAPHTVILSYSAWRDRFGARKEAIGKTVALNGVAHTIVGVLPRDFQFALTGPVEFWTTIHPSGDCDLRRSCHSLNGVARLRDGVSIRTALADMTSIAHQLEVKYPGSNLGQGASVMPLSEAIVGSVRPILLVLLSGAGLLLLIATVNVASLLLVRAENRRREMAVRGALGASRSRLVRQFATEGIVLVMIGSALGMASAWSAIRVLILLVPQQMQAGMPFLQNLDLNVRVCAFAAAISFLSALLFSLTPTARLSLSDVRDGMAEGSRGSAGNTWRRLGSKLVVLELATAMVLLVGAGLLGKSLYHLLQVNTGIKPDHLATLQVMAPQDGYPTDRQQVTLAREVTRRAANLPGVESAGVASRIALSGDGDTDWIRFVGRPYNGEHNEVNERDVSSGYFTALGASLLRGRYFDDAEDGSKPRVVIINQALAAKYFPNEDPIGKQFGDDGLNPKTIRTIVGIVNDIREGALDSQIWPTEYIPFDQSPDSSFGLVVRTSQDEASLLPTLAATLRGIDRRIATRFAMTMNDRLNTATDLQRSSAWIVGGFAALALLLSVVGLYGVVAYSVSRRTREIGVRMALGAHRNGVCRLILKEAGWLAALGIVIGLVCSVAAATLMRKLLFGVQSWDLATLAAVAVILGAAALLAGYLPARRAASVNPMEALRAE